MSKHLGNVLIVDDNPTNLSMLVDYLTVTGFEVSAAEDGPSALEMLVYITPDIILLDVMMPGMDGFETCRRLKAQPQTQEIPVIFMTALADIADKVKGFEAGAVDYVTKPVQHEEVLARLTTHLMLHNLKKLLEAQNAELNKLTQAVEQSANTIVITDAQGRIEYANPRFEETSGYTTAEAVGQTPRILKSGQHDEVYYRNLWQTITAGREWRGELHNKRKDGTLYWEQVSIAPVYSEAGQITHFMAIKEDITVRKQVEAALQRYTQELEASNAELDAFAHTVAHDLKNPLGVLLGYSELLAMRYHTLPPERIIDLLHTLKDTSFKMSNIINELLLLATVRKMDQIKTGPLDMAAIVGEARNRLSYMIDDSKAAMMAPENWPAAVGYTPWIEEVWVNYLSNALKYGGQPPRVELGFSLNGPAAVTFWVQDNGAGLTPEQQAKLFAPFERLEQTRAKGHGLGLSIVRRIVEKLGGQVGVTSEPGAGSRFFFTLPAAIK